MLKTLLIPIGIVAFLVFLILIGAFGLLVAMGVISGVKWIAGAPTRRRARRAARRAAAAGSGEAPQGEPSDTTAGAV